LERLECPFRVDGLTIDYLHSGLSFRAVDDVSFGAEPSKCLAIVGESGSGKSTLVRSLMGLLPVRSAQVIQGRLTLDGSDIDMRDLAVLKRLRGDKIAMVFQDSLSVLNPIMKVGKQIDEAVRHRLKLGKPGRDTRELLDAVALRRAVENAYPHELSGGMRQRVVIAIALASAPAVLIADEPTTALDVTTQAEIIKLLNSLRDETSMAMIFISHDIGVVSKVADDVIVMRKGKAIESGSLLDVFHRPQHPYTIGLIQASRGERGVDGRYVVFED
jgi:ABC-type glutathione transport system ATPase component